MPKLNESVAIVTGAAGGIGRATAVRLAAEGSQVGITDLNADGLKETAALIREAGGEVIDLVGDIVSADTIDELATKVVDAYGRIDGLVNNAGIVNVKPILENTVEDFDRMLHINTWSYLLTAKRVVPEMNKSGGGAIVNIASVGALNAIPDLGVYCTSKAAVLGLTRSMALELAPDVRVNAVCPGGVDTPMAADHFSSFPSREEALAELTAKQMMKRYSEPEELANVIVFMVGPESSFMTAAAVSADGGWTAW
jgi:NAD(P)-dependent dehydrogenase (short-subunit alcohol dehydrogenase family)